MNESMPGRYPAIVRSYDQASRECRVEIPGLTDGGDVFPLAEIEYPIGDKSRAGDQSTEIEIVAGDTVWIAFIGCDPRYPIITGWRNAKSGNGNDWRRYHHANIELLADGVMRLKVGSSSFTITPDSVAIVSDLLTHNGVNIGSTHVHGGVVSGGSNTSVPS